MAWARRYEEIKTDTEKIPLRETLRRFQQLGGKVIDSSPSYGTAESVVGELVDGLKVRDSLFLATKVSLRKVGREEGIAQIEKSFKKFRTLSLLMLDFAAGAEFEKATVVAALIARALGGQVGVRE